MMLKGPPLNLLEDTARRLPPDARQGYPSCVVPSVRSGPPPCPDPKLKTPSMTLTETQASDPVKNGSPSPRPNHTHYHQLVPQRTRPLHLIQEVVKHHPVLGGFQPQLEEQFLPTRIVGCCLCGILLAGVLLYLLYEYVREQTEFQTPHVDVGHVEFVNQVFAHRVADIIRTAASEAVTPSSGNSWRLAWSGLWVTGAPLARVLGSGVKRFHQEGGLWVSDDGARGGGRREMAVVDVEGGVGGEEGVHAGRLKPLSPSSASARMSAFGGQDGGGEGAFKQVCKLYPSHLDVVAAAAIPGLKSYHHHHHHHQSSHHKTAKPKRQDHKTFRKSHHPQCAAAGHHKQRYHYAISVPDDSQYHQQNDEDDCFEDLDDYEYLESYFESSLDQLEAELLGASVGSSTSPSERREKVKKKMSRPRRRSPKERSGKGKGTELLVFTFFLVVMMLTLSQVLVVHHKYNGHYGQVDKPRSARLKAREEMRMVDRSISALRRQHIPSPQQAEEFLRKFVYTNRIADLIRRASQESQTLLDRRAQLHERTNSTSSSKKHSSGALSSTSSSRSSSSLSTPSKSVQSDRTSSASGNLSAGNPVPVTSVGVVKDVTERSEVGTRSVVGEGMDTGSPEDLEKKLAAEEEGTMTTSSGSAHLQPCPLEPTTLLGNVSGDVDREHKTLTLSQVRARHGRDLVPGGEWSPPDCLARYRLAIIIPYRDRLAHLTVLLAHLLPVLKRQQLHFRIFVVEQNGNLTFNKGRIMNAAFKEALKMYDFQCVVFHDVDLIPEDDRNMYSCPVMPRHMSVAINEMNYKLLYNLLVGGVLNLRVEHYQQVNGYSNMYWGWGGEDDDMAYRILHEKLKIIRPPVNIARYQMIKHTKRKPTSWNIRSRLLRTAVKRYHLDGLNSVQYTIKFIHADPLYTHIMVDIGRPDIRV